MNLFEYEGKRMMAKFAIPTPGSRLLATADAPAPLPYPFVLKAQVLTGGRGKAGGVKICHNDEEYTRYAHDILGMTIKGHVVHGLLAEEMVKADRELYLSITAQGVKNPTLIASAMGGMDIEQVAATQPEEILKLEIDPFTGLKDYQLSMLAQKLRVEDKADLFATVRKIEKAFFATNALLVEINPLGVVNGKLMAMDSKFVLDDHAEFRMKEVFQEIRDGREAIHYEAPKGDGTTITFVPLEGEIGLISDGAGTGMLTLDMVNDEGGTVASFCELGGTTNADVMYKAMEYTMGTGKPIKSLLIVLIGGFNRMDDMANGITRYIQDHGIDVPIFTRMCGTMEEEGIAIMKEHGLSTYNMLLDTVKDAVAASKEGR